MDRRLVPAGAFRIARGLLTYRFDLHRSALFIQPDFQYITKPGGTGRLENASVFGAQLGINF